MYTSSVCTRLEQVSEISEKNLSSEELKALINDLIKNNALVNQFLFLFSLLETRSLQAEGFKMTVLQDPYFAGFCFNKVLVLLSPGISFRLTLEFTIDIWF